MKEHFDTPMPIQSTSKIWYNGNLIPWEQATIHVMSHVIHYGSSVFEGIRCYAQPHGSAVFRLPEHMQRLLDSAKIYRMELPFSLDELCAGVVELIESNGVAPCYVRPIALRGYGEIGVSPKGSPIEVYIANFPMGQVRGRPWRRGRLHLQLEPTGAQHHACPRQSRRQLYELPAHSHGSRHQRLRRRHRDSTSTAWSARAPAKTSSWSATACCTRRSWPTLRSLASPATAC